MKQKIIFFSIFFLFLAVCCFFVFYDKYEKRIWISVYNYSDNDFQVHIYNEKNSFAFLSEKKTFINKNACRLKGNEICQNEFNIEISKAGNILLQKEVSFPENGITSYSAYGGLDLSMEISEDENDCIELSFRNLDLGQLKMPLKNGNEKQKKKKIPLLPVNGN